MGKRGIVVSNCPGYCVEDVSGHAIGLMLDLMHQITFTNRDTVAGGWGPNGGYLGYRTQGRTLGLVFFGRIAVKRTSLYPSPSDPFLLYGSV